MATSTGKTARKGGGTRTSIKRDMRRAANARARAKGKTYRPSLPGRDKLRGLA